MKKTLEFVDFIENNQNVSDKDELIELVSGRFSLIKDRKVYFCEEFAVRFSFSRTGSFSNTVLSLSKLQKFDHIPFFVCLVTPEQNKLFLANSTFLSNVSHSSQKLSMYNIKGSFNGSDIVKEFNGITNTGQRTAELFAIHEALGFEGNLQRLVEATNDIQPTGKAFDPDDSQKIELSSAARRSIEFCQSPDFKVLADDLRARVEKFKDAIFIAGHIENGKIRGGIIEYLITGEDDDKKESIANEIKVEYGKLPAFKLNNDLGDYERTFENHHTATDIKTKIVFLDSNPKGYNIDKFLEFHSRSNTVFLFYFIGIDEKCIVSQVLVPVFHTTLLDSTILLHHWAGRNSRGVTQFIGKSIQSILDNPSVEIDEQQAREFVNRLLNL